METETLNKERRRGVRVLHQALLLLVTLGLIAPSSAHAYLDAGTGSMIIQAVIATVAGSAVLLRLYWAKLKGLLAGKTPETTGDDESADR